MCIYLYIQGLQGVGFRMCALTNVPKESYIHLPNPTVEPCIRLENQERGLKGILTGGWYLNLRV